MNWKVRVQAYPLRAKVLITLVGAGLALLGVSTHLSFRYWKAEAVTAAEQQALLAAASARIAVEAGLQAGRTDQARRALRRLHAHAPITAARVYATDGIIVISAEPSEEGRRPDRMWLPSVRELPVDGLVRVEPDNGLVRAFMPLPVPPAALLEIEYSLGPLRQAMDRGARLGLGLLIGSVFALTAILFTMLEREVVAPLTRMSDLLGPNANLAPRTNELNRIEAGVTELLQKEQAVEGMAAESERRLAEQAGFAQVGEMAAEMAHEFKRPLASIQSAIHLLSQEYVLEERGQRLLGAVEDQLGHLTETMRDLFALAKPVGLDKETMDVADVLDRSLMQLAGHPAATGLTVRREYAGGAVMAPGDPKRLEQVVLNLMLNAAESMTGAGELSLRCGTTDGMAWFEVGDTGVGIPESEVDKVLLPFYSTKPAGTGLGLPLVARIVAAHNGRITIDSQLGVGTRVRVELPAAEGIIMQATV